MSKMLIVAVKYSIEQLHSLQLVSQQSEQITVLIMLNSIRCLNIQKLYIFTEE
jgi:hypothetical protein